MPKKELVREDLIAHSDPKSPVAEAFRILRTNLYYSNLDKELKKVMVTSAGPAEGKSTILSNLAVTVAQTEQKVLLIDADLRKPVQHKVFGVSNQRGLTNLLVEDLDLSEVIQETQVKNLSILASGPIPPNPSELLGSKRMDKFLDSISGFDIVFIDAPPAVAVTDPAVIAPKVDGVLMVINSKKVKIEMAQHAKAQLENAKGRILGVILNNVEYKGADYQYYYYYGEDK
ncbi:capsular exopolysaccharide synthesis family protein [Desulfitispora alkaliphila]|uniref:CpsD/CapB family tyrosine-protein kinase n=1 Tax=Desulfitispora alkaliphila TaxID=622674 RepID=UPI003D21DBB6